MKTLTIAPNKPLLLALVDPEGAFDFDRGMGTYQTTTGATLTLPRPAVVILNELDPRPGEEIEILKSWSGKPKDKVQWVIRLSTKSEKARAAAGEPDTLTKQLEQSIAAINPGSGRYEPATPIRKPPKRAPVPITPGRLFDRGTGTYGPAPLPNFADRARFPLPAAAVNGNRKPGQIPANIATREILEFIKSDPSTANWGDQAVQDLLSTILIASFKAGYIGLWERK